ncbi:MAG: pirin family protein, partial [Sandaracinaceae bacterium]
NQRIQPGAINWMTAGRGIVHSERTPPERRAEGARLHGIQLWLALPKEHEETEPEFHHHPAATIPELTQGDVQIRVLAGSYAGATSPVRTFSPLFYVEARMPAGARLDVRPEHEERALYVGEGEVGCGDERARPGRIWILQPGRTVSVEASEPSRVMLLGGPPLDGERFMFWNFVSSRRERIEQAKRDWREDRFDEVPGDELERIPLPE